MSGILKSMLLLGKEDQELKERRIRQQVHQKS